MLSVDAEKKNLYLSRKKALVESSLPLFLSYADARPGLVSHGYVVSVKDFGCIVRFYNDVRGLVPLNELSSQPIINPEEMFYVGQVRRSGSVGTDCQICFYLCRCSRCLGTCNNETLCCIWHLTSCFFVFFYVGRPGVKG